MPAFVPSGDDVAWSAVLALSLFSGILALGACCRRQLSSGFTRRLLGSCLAAILVAVLVAIGLGRTRAISDEDIRFALQVGLIAAGWAGLWLLRPGASRVAPGRLGPAALAVLGLGLSAWLYWSRLETQLTGPPTVTLAEADASFRARHFPEGSIQTAPPDPSYVCHDWTFLDDASAIRRGDVDDILDRAGYLQTTTPRPGDVIVYRGPDGSVMHTGRVKAIGADDFVLIESKWGHLSRLLHLPDVPTLPLKASYTYYHAE